LTLDRAAIERRPALGKAGWRVTHVHADFHDEAPSTQVAAIETIAFQATILGVL
jgi:hypothetical protein